MSEFEPYRNTVADSLKKNSCFLCSYAVKK